MVPLVVKFALKLKLTRAPRLNRFGFGMSTTSDSSCARAGVAAARAQVAERSNGFITRRKQLRQFEDAVEAAAKSARRADCFGRPVVQPLHAVGRSGDGWIGVGPGSHVRAVLHKIAAANPGGE